MRDKIQTLVKFFNLMTADELYAALSKDKHIKKKTFQKCLDNLEDEGAVIRVLPSENSLAIEGYIRGPNLSVSKESKEFLLECDMNRRNLDVYYSSVVKRLSRKLVEDIKALIEKTALIYENPKKLEMEYFEISLKYHELRGYFLRFDINAFNGIESNLSECRELLNKLEM